MFLRRKQKPSDDEQPIPHLWSWQATEREEVGRSKTGTVPFAEFSKLTAKMVELSLRESQRDRTLRGTVPNKLNGISSPLLWQSTDVQRITPPPTESAGRPGTAPQGAVGTTPLYPSQEHRTPGGLRIENFAVLYSRATIILREMTNHWNEVPRTLGSWLARLSARLRILTNSQPLRRLTYGCRKNLRFPFFKPYRCRDCGKRAGFRSSPRTMMERYILPLTLMQPVRCAECSRRDYRLIFTPVSERSHHRDESSDPIHRDAA